MRKSHRTDLKEYHRLSALYLKENKQCGVCGKPSKEVHHKAGRTGFLLTHLPLWMPVCRACHDDIHFGSMRGKGPKWAEENGYKVNLCWSEFEKLKKGIDMG
jgi:hypothetical protein